MELFIAAFKSVAVLMGIGVLGFTILARKTLPINALSVITPLVIDVSLPCMIFYNIIARFDPQTMPGWWQLPLWWLGMVVFFLGLSLACMRFVNREYRGEAGMTLFYPNATFFPIGIIPIIYGPDTILLVELFIFTLFMPIIVFNGYTFFFRPKGQDRKFNFKDSRILNPILVATILAVVFKLTRIDVAPADAQHRRQCLYRFCPARKIQFSVFLQVCSDKKRTFPGCNPGHAAVDPPADVGRDPDHHSGGGSAPERRAGSDRKGPGKCDAGQPIPDFQLHVFHHHHSVGYVVFQSLL